MKKSLQNAISTWISAALLLVVGILCIVCENSDAQTGGNAANAISIIVGVVLVISASFGLILAVLVAKKVLNPATIAYGAILAAGIYFIVCKTLTGLLGVITDYAPFVILIMGILLVLDATLVLVLGLKAKRSGNEFILPVVLEYVIGAFAIVVGVLALPSVNVISKRLTILGIILIVYGVAMLGLGFLVFQGKQIKPSKKDEAITVDNNSNE